MRWPRLPSTPTHCLRKQTVRLQYPNYPTCAYSISISFKLCAVPEREARAPVGWGREVLNLRADTSAASAEATISRHKYPETAFPLTGTSTKYLLLSAT